MNRQMKRMQERAERQQKRAGSDRGSAPASRRAQARAQARTQTQEKRKRSGALQFLREVRQELKKVDWPNRTELISYTIVVLATVAVTTAFVFVLDYVFSKSIFSLF